MHFKTSLFLNHKIYTNKTSAMNELFCTILSCTTDMLEASYMNYIKPII